MGNELKKTKYKKKYKEIEIANNSFLEFLIKKFNVNFETIMSVSKLNNVKIKCRDNDGLFYSLEDREPCTCIKGGIVQI